jgi:hypothetical protein
MPTAIDKNKFNPLQKNTTPPMIKLATQKDKHLFLLKSEFISKCFRILNDKNKNETMPANTPDKAAPTVLK